MGDVFEVQEIIESRLKSNGKTEYKIRWRGFGPDEDTWEPEKNLIDCQEILNNYKKEQSEPSIQNSRRTQTTRSTPQISKTRLAESKAGVSTREQRVTEVAMATNTPALRRTKVRQRSTPKVQRVLGIKQMPTNVIDKTAVEISGNGRKTESAPSDQEVKDTVELDKAEYVPQCNKWAMLAGVVCMAIGALLLLYPDLLKK